MPPSGRHRVTAFRDTRTQETAQGRLRDSRGTEMALFNRSSGEMEPFGSLLTTFGPGTYPIGQNRYGLQGIVPGIYRVETAPYYEGDRDLTNYIGWSLHNSPNPAFDQVLRGGNQTPFLLPVADAKFLTVKSKGGLWILAEAY